MSKPKKKSKRTAFTNANVQWWTQQECERISENATKALAQALLNPDHQQRNSELANC